MVKKYIVIYTDSEFPLNEENIFRSNRTYDSRANWYKKTSMDYCEPLIFVQSDLPNLQGLCLEIMEQIVINAKNNRR